MLSLEICIDVPDLERGVRFFGEAFGFSKVAEPYPGVALLKAGEAAVTLLQKAEGSRSAPGSGDSRSYERHWTPVHIDFHVDDLPAAIARAVKAGATAERVFEDGSIAFCSDPFGHGFCLLANKV
jgi:predicted enzyme related to lactoylglutathione lyase